MRQTLETTRDFRGLPPYESPKKDWDTPIFAEPHLLVARAPSNRRYRRIRQRDLASMGRKSRRKADRQAFEQRQAEHSLRGQAWVYLQGEGTPAMRENVRREIHGLAGALAARNDEEWADSIKRVEGELLKIQQAYGDDL